MVTGQVTSIEFLWGGAQCAKGAHQNDCF